MPASSSRCILTCVSNPVCRSCPIFEASVCGILLRNKPLPYKLHCLQMAPKAAQLASMLAMEIR